MTVRPARAAAFVMALALAGCNSGQDPTVEAGDDTTSSSTGSTVASSTTSTTGAPVTPPVSVVGQQTERAFLTAVRVAVSDNGGSRIVFEFDPVVPGYAIEYVERPVTEDGSGDEVEVEGAAVLQVRMADAATARIVGESVVRTYTGPDRVPPVGTGGVAVEAVDVGDFEGQVTWAVGLRQKATTLNVMTLDGPPRLVIDVPAPTAAG